MPACSGGSSKRAPDIAVRKTRNSGLRRKDEPTGRFTGEAPRGPRAAGRLVAVTPSHASRSPSSLTGPHSRFPRRGRRRRHGPRPRLMHTRQPVGPWSPKPASAPTTSPPGMPSGPERPSQVRVGKLRLASTRCWWGHVLPYKQQTTAGWAAQPSMQTLSFERSTLGPCRRHRPARSQPGSVATSGRAVLSKGKPPRTRGLAH